MPPFTFQPPPQPFVGTIADLMMRGPEAIAHAAQVAGEARARAQENSAAMFGNAIAGIGQAAAGVPAQIQASKDAAQRREFMTLQLADAKRAFDTKAAFTSALKDPANRDDKGNVDWSKISKSLMDVNPDAAMMASSYANAMDEHVLKVRKELQELSIGDATLAEKTQTARAKVADALGRVAYKGTQLIDANPLKARDAALAGLAYAAGEGLIPEPLAHKTAMDWAALGPDDLKTRLSAVVPDELRAKLDKETADTAKSKAEAVKLAAEAEKLHAEAAAGPKLDEWNSFQQSYAKSLLGATGKWSDLNPQQQISGFGQFSEAKADPAMRGLAMTLKQIQIGQQPTADDAHTVAQQIVNHNLAPSQLNLFGGFGAAGAAFKRMVGTAALKIDPSFNWEEAESNYQLVKSPGFQNTVRYMDSVTESIPRLEQNAKNIGNGNFRTLNQLANAAKNQFNDTDLKRFKVDATLVGDEVAKLLQGGGSGSATSDAKLKQAQDLINASDSVPAIAAAIQEVQALIGNRRRALVRGTYFDKPASSTPMVNPFR